LWQNDLALRLAEITPGDLQIVTFANSGAETVEAAIKLARVRTGRDVILSTWNSFHGKTLGALSATGKPMYQRDFGGPAQNFSHVPYGDLDALRARLMTADGDQIAAFIVEPIQGEGGVICPPDGYIDGVIALCREFGVLSVLDEIQTGLGRTGSLFACSDCSEPPDMLLSVQGPGRRDDAHRSLHCAPLCLGRPFWAAAQLDLCQQQPCLHGGACNAGKASGR
jgi:acetylornithine/succinyldiaminopimelate/putrescine aminotransferase